MMSYQVNRSTKRWFLTTALAVTMLAAAVAPSIAQPALHGTVEISFANGDGTYQTPVRWALGGLYWG